KSRAFNAVTPSRTVRLRRRRRTNGQRGVASREKRVALAATRSAQDNLWSNPRGTKRCRSPKLSVYAHASSAGAARCFQRLSTSRKFPLDVLDLIKLRKSLYHSSNRTVSSNVLSIQPTKETIG